MIKKATSTLIPSLDKAKGQIIKLSEKTIVKKEEANSFLTNVADVTLFLTKTTKETFTRDFEFKEFFSPLIGASLDADYLIPIAFYLMER